MKTLAVIIVGIIGVVLANLVASAIGMDLFRAYGFWKPVIYICMILWIGMSMSLLSGAKKSE